MSATRVERVSVRSAGTRKPVGHPHRRLRLRLLLLHPSTVRDDASEGTHVGTRAPVALSFLSRSFLHFSTLHLFSLSFSLSLHLCFPLFLSSSSSSSFLYLLRTRLFLSSLPFPANSFYHPFFSVFIALPSGLSYRAAGNLSPRRSLLLPAKRILPVLGAQSGPSRSLS
jgi:hypothetical protein